MSKYDTSRASYAGWWIKTIEDVDARLAALERKQEATAPEPTSAELYAWFKDDRNSLAEGYHLATLAQVRAEAVRLGLLDTPRQKVAEAFLHAALLDAMDNEDEDYTGIIAGLRYLINTTNKWWIEGMIAVLEQPSKGEGNG
jgi:hypothetical protein